MAQRTRILIADRDLNSLSRIYLALLHRNYKVEATNLTEEIPDRTKRLKPSLLILESGIYEMVKDSIKTPVIVLHNQGEEKYQSISSDIIWMEKNVAIEKLVKMIQEMVY